MNAGEQERYRRYWGVCDDCLVAIVVEVHPDAGRDATLPPEEDWDQSFPDCPVCGRGNGWEGADSTTSGEDEAARLRRQRERYEVLAEYRGDAEPAAPAAEPLVEALRLIDRNGCATFTRGRCLDAASGRLRDAVYGADKWCDACVAHAALAEFDRQSSRSSTDTSESGEQL